MAFRNGFTNRPKGVKEKNSGVNRVERAGYIPTKQRVEQFLAAGKNLSAYRLTQYDVKAGEEESAEIDPFRKKDVDLADVSQAQLYLDLKKKQKGSKPPDPKVDKPAEKPVKEPPPAAS